MTSSSSSNQPQTTEPPATVDDLAMLIRQLAHSLKKAKPDSDLAARAVDYLRRKGLQGDVFSRGKVCWPPPDAGSVPAEPTPAPRPLAPAGARADVE